MIVTGEQRRWWFATHPEYSWSYQGGTEGGQREEEGDNDTVSPEDIDSYVDNAMDYVHGPVADLLRSVKRNFGTEGLAAERPSEEGPRWDTEAGGQSGPRSGRGWRGGLDIRDWIRMSRQERRARDAIETELENAGANCHDYRLTSFLGQFVAQRDRIFDPNQTDPQGRTNAQRINLRLAPLGKDGKPIVLHHAGQSSAGPIIEMTSSEHGAVRVRQEPSQINRTEFREFRVIYWQARLALIRGLD